MRLSACLWGSSLASLLLVGTAFGGLLTEVSNLDNASTLNFESVAAPTTIAGNDTLFTDFGISQVSAVAADGGDVQNQTGQSGNALFANTTDGLFVLPQNNGAYTFGTTTSFTLDLTEKHSNFGVSFQDQADGTFTLEFFNGGSSIGTIDKSIPGVQDTLFLVNSTEAFDRVEISGGAVGDGWGIDNIQLVDSVREITLADFVGSYTTIDFESVGGPTTIAGDDPLFTDLGLRVSATGGSQSGDVSSVNNANDQALYFNGTDLLVLPDSGFNASAWPYGGDQEFTLDFSLDQKRLGIVFGDQGTGDFQYDFYRDGELQASYVDLVPNLNATTLYYETDFWFDRVDIDALTSDGFGIDNITFGVVPEPSSFFLVGFLMAGLVLGRRQRRRR